MNIIKWLLDWRVRYFTKKLKGVRCMIEDLNFKRFKTKEIREEVRQVFDQQKAKLLSLETTIKQEKEKEASDTSKIPDGDVARLEDETVRLKRDIERYAAQIKGMDIDVEGSRETNEFPDGVAGINQQIDSLRELEGMLKDFIKGL